MTTKGKLLLGLVGLIIIWLFLLIFEWDDVEKDIAGRVSNTLSTEGHDWATVDTDNQGRTVSLSGITRAESEIADAKKMAEDIYGVHKVDISSIQYEPLTAAQFQVKQGEGGVILSGTVDSESSADALRKMVRAATSVPITDQLVVSSDTESLHWIDDFGNLVPTIAGIEQPEFGFKDNNFSLSGITRNQQQLDSIAYITGGLGDGRTLDSAGLSFMPYQSPKFSMANIHGVIVASGVVGQSSVADTLTAAVTAFGAPDVINDVQVVVDENTSEAEWIDVITELSPAIKSLEGGSISASDEGVKVAGIARSQKAYDHALAAIETSGVNSNITLRLWNSPNIEITESDGKIIASGLLPNQDILDKVDKLAGTLASDLGLEYENAMTLDTDVQTADWLNSVSDLIPQMNTLQQPMLMANQDGLSVSGVASSERDRDRISSLAIDAANSLSVSNAIKYEKAVISYNLPKVALNQCERDLDNKMVGENIEFATGSANLSPSSFSLLNVIVSAIYDCPEVIIEVSGHTDNTGSEATNLQLSERRAESVVEYLISAGVPVEKLSAVGVGSVRPIADNDTAEGRATNRRIEFNIKY